MKTKKNMGIKTFIYKTLSLAALLFASHVTPTIAQDMGLIEESTYNGKGVALEDITFDGTTSERILFYNIGRKRFLNAGGFWGTRTATHTVGLPLIIEKVEKGNGFEDYYLIQSPLKNGNDIYMAKVTEDQEEGNVRNGVFFDREKTVSNRIAPRWRITRVEYKDIDNPQEYGINEDDIVYKIECRTDDNYAYNNNLKNNLELVGNCKMTISVFEEGNYNLVRGLPTTHANYDKKYSYWKIVNLKEFNETTTNAKNYYNEQPIDLTFLIRGQNFNRLNKYNLVPQEESLTTRGWSTNYKDVGGSSTTDDWYKTDSAAAKAYYRPSGLSTSNYDSHFNNYHGDGKFGMFYCGRITGVKITDDTKPNYTIYQNIPVTQPGWYRIDCQGFYKNNGSDCLARIFAISDDMAASGTAKNAYVNLLPQHYLKYYDENISESKDAYNYDTNYILADLKAHKAPDNYVEAGVAFYTGCYPNSVLVYVSKENTNIKTGIEVLKRSMTDDEAIYFDDFRLKYLGQSFSLDDQGKLNSEGDFKYKPLVLRRALKEDKWNSILLPVNLTKKQVNTTFFPYPRIAEFTGFKDRNTIEFKAIDLDKFSEDDIVMQAGHCYILKPGYNGNIGDVEIEIGDNNMSTMTGPYYMIDRVSYNSGNIPEIEKNTEPFTIAGSDCELNIKGQYEPHWISKNAYMLYEGTLFHLTNNYFSKGYSWWIEDKHQMEPSGKRHNLFMSIADSNETTGIISINIGKETTDENCDTYNLQGQKMSAGTALPSGVYIRNGKKHIVK